VSSVLLFFKEKNHQDLKRLTGDFSVHRWFIRKAGVSENRRDDNCVSNASFTVNAH